MDKASATSDGLISVQTLEIGLSGSRQLTSSGLANEDDNEDIAAKGQILDQFNSPATDVNPLETVWREAILKQAQVEVQWTTRTGTSSDQLHPFFTCKTNRNKH